MNTFLGAVGDLVEDVVVQLLESVNLASDTASVVNRRRGGSAANMVEAACRAGGSARFIGQVGDDAAGHWLVEQLATVGADVVVRHRGRSGTIVVLVDPSGERTMLADRASCTDLDQPEPTWLDGLHTLHIPYYSLVGEPLASTTATLAAWANARGIRVSVDTSSAALLEAEGADRALDRIAELRPQIVLANELEAAVLGDGLRPDRLNGATVIVKRGAAPCTVTQAGVPPVEVPALSLAHVRDTTGAGDAFAAGLLLALAEGDDVTTAVGRGHAVAADTLLRSR